MIEQLAKQIVNDVQRVFDAEKPDASRLKSLLESSLRKMNLVSREEFDAQQKVLARTRLMLEDMEARFTDLQRKLEEEQKKT